MTRRSTRSLLTLGALALTLVFAACGGPQSTVVRQATATPTATATPQPTITPSVMTACFGADAAGLKVTKIGDLLFAPITFGYLSYPSVQLPDGLSLSEPYKMPDSLATVTPGAPAGVSLINPKLTGLGAGLLLLLCNTATAQSHMVTSVSARIDAFTPYSGLANQWPPCEASVNSHLQLSGGGCGGSSGPCVCVGATFPDGAAQGTTVVAANQPSADLGLPVTLAPGEAGRLFVSILLPSTPSTTPFISYVPNTPGYYTFNLGTSIDGATAFFPAAPGPKMLLAPAHLWQGQICMDAPSLKAQITPTSPETYYVCGK
jgi:hypothetical protein